MGNRLSGNRFNAKVPANGELAVRTVETAHVKEITEQDFDAQVVAEPLPVALDFYGKTSKACEALGPRFAAVAERFAGKVRFLRISRSENAALAERLGVTTSPTIVFLRGGEVKGDRLSGDAIKRPELKARVEAMLGIKPPAPTPPAAK